MSTPENQIVVYQPNETVRLDMRLENETVWLTQAQLSELFGVVKSNVSYHLKTFSGPTNSTTRQLFKKFEQFGRKQDGACPATSSISIST